MRLYEKELPMKIVCSWCRREGKSDFVGEKAPFDDPRETHGICLVHRHEVEARWWSSRRSTLVSEGSGALSSAFSQWTGLMKVTKKTGP